MATRVSMLVPLCKRALNPFTKNFLLITRTIPESSISMIPMPTMLCSRKGGTGQPHIEAPMEKYMSTIRNTIELTSLLLRTGVSWSSSRASMFLSRLLSALSPFVSGEAPYPASSTALIIFSGSAVPVTLIEFVRSDTLHDSTPSTPDTAFSTCAWHAAQLIPVTKYFSVFVPMLSIRIHFLRLIVISLVSEEAQPILQSFHPNRS